MDLSASPWKMSPRLPVDPSHLGCSPARGMLFQVLLPARGQLIGLEVGIYDEFPAISWLGHLHLLIEDFLPLTSGQAGRHGPGGRKGNLNSA